VNEAEHLDERELLKQSIERDEAELREAVDELKAAVQSEFSIRRRIVEHPTPWLAGGFLFGLWLGRSG
jgi:hypothetical protein